MTTRLSQRKVKAGSPAYLSLHEEMQSRAAGSGTDYVFPVGGMPRTDMSLDVQEALAKAEKAYLFPVGGISESDLTQSIVNNLLLAVSAYQKPVTGIPATDLEIGIQERLNNFSDFYVYPSTGIPYVDLDSDLKDRLDIAETAYQKPTEGIPSSDLSEEVQDLLEQSLIKYTKPEGGIPLEDLSTEVITREEFNTYADGRVIVTSHGELQDIGEFTHTQIDRFLEEHESSLIYIDDEIDFARGGYSTLGRRLDEAFFESHDFIIKDRDFLEGEMTNLVLSQDKHLHFVYTPEQFPVEFYDMSTTAGYEQSNRMVIRPVDVIEMKWPTSIVDMNGLSYANNVGIVIDGFLFAPIDGMYSFGIQASGDYSFTINETTGTFSAADTTGWDDDHVLRPIDIKLTGGQFYRFTLTGKNRRASNSIVRAVWKRPDMKTFEPIRKEFFSKTGYNSPDEAIYETVIIDTQKLDIRQLKWDVITDFYVPYSYLSIEWRQGTDGLVFGEWIPYTFGMEVTENIERFIQAKLTITRGSTNRSPVIKEIHLDYLSNKNNLYHEWEEARQGYPNLRSHMDALNDRINGVEDLATSIDHSVIDTTWLQNIRFEHIDINMLRLHWEQLKALKTSAHIFPSGFVEDFHDLKLMDENFHKMEVKNSRLYPVPYFEIFDTDADWMKWDRLNLSPEAGSLQLTFVANGQMTGPATEKILDNGNSAGNNATGMTLNQSVYQPFPVPKDSYKITEVNVSGLAVSYTNNSNGHMYGRASIYISSLNDDGSYNHSKEVYLGMTGYQGNHTSWFVFSANYVIPGDVKGMCIRYQYTPSYNYYSPGTMQTYSSSNPDPAYTGKGSLFFGRDSSGNAITNRYMPLRIMAYRGYHSEGEAQTIIDVGIDTKFIEPEIDLAVSGGSIEVTYASSHDGIRFSPQVHILNEVPDGRYLKIWTRLSRTDSNQSPKINRLAIRHNPNDVTFQTKVIRVSRVPTHVILDIADSDKVDLSYEVSRDGAQTFKSIVPGIQTDVRDIGTGQDMVVRIFSERFEQDDNVWIDYIGLQTITHEDYNDKSVIVSHHQVESATEGQTQVDLTKSYLLGDDSLQVYVNGSYQIEGESYDETNNRSITFRSSLREGDKVVLRIASAAYAFESSEGLEAILVESKQLIESTLPILQSLEPRLLFIEGDQERQDTEIQTMNSTLNERIDELYVETDDRFIELSTRMDETEINTEASIEAVGSYLIAVDADLDVLTGTVTTMDEKITLINTVVQGLTSEDTVLSSQLTLLQQTVDGMMKELEEVKALMAIGTTDFERLKEKVEAIDDKVTDIQLNLVEVFTRLDAIDVLNLKQDADIGLVESSVYVMGSTVSDEIKDVQTTLEGSLSTAEESLGLQISTMKTELQGDVSTVRTELTDEITVVRDSVTSLTQSTTTEFEGLTGRLQDLEYTHPTDATRVNRDKLALNLDALDADIGTNGIQLVSDVVLPTKGEWETTITWQSDKPQFVNGSGKVTTPSYTQGDQAILLTATIAYGVDTDTKTFIVNVDKNSPTEEEMSTADHAALSIAHIDQDETTPGIQVTTDVELPLVGSVWGSLISWTSSDEIHFSNDGLVVQPEAIDGDASITLTATVTNGSIVNTKAFVLTVPALPEPEPEIPIEPDPDPIPDPEEEV